MATFAKNWAYLWFEIFALSSLFFRISYCQVGNPYFEKTCGVLYSQDEFQGQEFPFNDGEQSVNLGGDYRASENWNRTGSISIASGCKLNVCNETYFNGICHDLDQSSYYLSNLSTVFDGSVASVGCMCKKECKCEDIFMKKASCARAYLKGGCKTCGTPYVDLISSKTYFAEEFSGKVEALKLRKGCTLTLYSGEEVDDYDNEVEIVNEEIVEDYKGTFKSYQCECNDDEYVAKPRPLRSPLLPPLIKIPNSVDEVINMLKNETYAGHPGLLSALKSMKNGRSGKNAYILLLGTTGAGKSSSINLLFDNPNITKIGDEFSTTTDIHLFPRQTIISVAENKARSEELPMVNGYFKLPNNEYYPRNLFEKMELVTNNGEDLVGQGVFRTAFRDSENFNVSSSSFKLLDRGGAKVDYYFRILANSFFGVNKTQVSQLLQQTWDNDVPESVKTLFPDSLLYLQKSLNIQNINTKEDIPRTTNAILQLLTALKHDQATIMLLDKALQIKPPTFPQNVIAGYSYNVFRDTPLSTSPFKLGDLQQSDIGFMIPKILSCKLEQSATQNFLVFENQQEYLQHRLKSLGIEGNITGESFKGALKPGHNIKSRSFQNDSCKLSAAREFRNFEFILNDKPEFTKEFVTAVKSLPVFDAEDFEVVQKWNEFFNEYGTHVVRSVRGGVAIEINLERNHACDENIGGALFDLIKFAEDMSYMIIDENQNATNNSNRTILKDGIQHSLNFVGGDMQYHTSDLTKMPIENAAKFLNKWKKSLKFYPTVLPTEMRLMPLSQIVRRVGQNYSLEIERATSLLFNSSLKFAPPTKKRGESAPGASRDETPLMTQTELLLNMQKSNERIEQLMKKIQQMEDSGRNQMDDLKLNMAIDQVRMEEEQTLQRQLDQIGKEDHNTRNQRNIDARRNSASRLQKLIATIKWEHEKMRKEGKSSEEITPGKLVSLAKAAMAEEEQKLYAALVNRTRATGCLREGTKILMADFTEKSVEHVQVGDVILDKELKPTRVLGVIYEFLMTQTFFGFDKNSHFFTSNHLFVGPSLDGKCNENFQLYAKSKENLFAMNPLMKYLNVKDMDDHQPLKVFQIDEEQRAVSVKDVMNISQDSQEYSPETLVYDIQVDSPSGTYFCNGFVCRHEIPPVEYWPNTMSILFRLMETKGFKALSQLPYTLENVSFLRSLNNKVAEAVNLFMESNEWKNGSGKDYEIMKLEDVNVEECISKIFSSPTISTAAVGLYAAAGEIIAPYLDDVDVGHQPKVDDKQLGNVQHQIYTLMIEQLNKYM